MKVASVVTVGLLLYGFTNQARGLPLLKTYSDTIGRAVVQGVTTQGSDYANRLETWFRPNVVLSAVRACGRPNETDSTRSFTVAGEVKENGQMSELYFAPRNAWVSCIATNIAKTKLPQPPAGSAYWPLSLRFDTQSGVMLNVSGVDSRKVFTTPPRPPAPYSAPFAFYTPQALPIRGLAKSGAVPVRFSLNADGSVQQATTHEQLGSLESLLVLDAARQWAFDADSSNGSRDVTRYVEVSPAR